MPNYGGTAVDTYGNFVTVVEHGATASTARPTGAVRVFWRGTVAPTNAVQYDRWTNTTSAPYVESIFNGATWDVFGSGTYALPAGATIGLIGDSITNNIGTLNSYQFDNGYWSWAGTKLGHRIRLTYIDGVPGTGCTNAGWANRVTALAASGASWAGIEIGTNDVAGGSTTAAIIAALTTTLTTLRAAGMRVLLHTVPPRNGLTVAQQQVHADVNTWIRQRGLVGLGVVVADVAAYLSDPANATPAQYVAAYSGDGTHPTPLGAQAWGQCIFDTLSPLLPPVNSLVRPSDKGNLVPYAAASWAGGAAAQPTGWAGTNTGLTWSQTTRPDGRPGVAQRLVIPAGGSCGIHVAFGGYGVGDRLVGFLEVLSITGVDAAPAANTQHAYPYLQAFTAAYGSAGVTADLNPNGTQPNVPPVAGRWQTPTLVIPANGLQEVDLFLSMTGGATYLLGDVGVAKVGATY